MTAAPLSLASSSVVFADSTSLTETVAVFRLLSVEERVPIQKTATQAHMRVAALCKDAENNQGENLVFYLC